VESGLFLAEGLHPVGEALAAGWEATALLYGDEVLKSKYGRSLVEGSQGRGLNVSNDVLASISSKENPQGILAILRQRETRISDLRQVQKGVGIVAPQDPGNVGAIIRTMDAAGADTLFILDDGVDIFHPTLVRASMGACFWIPIVELEFGAFVEWCRERGIILLGTTAHGASRSTDLAVRPPWVLLLGNEQKGLSAGQQRSCNQILSLPMHGRGSSLNLAVAAGIMLYDLGGPETSVKVEDVSRGA
jgi:TrmH family RNA methyltransferase